MPILEPTRRDVARVALTTTALSYSRILGANEKVNFGLNNFMSHTETLSGIILRDKKEAWR